MDKNTVPSSETWFTPTSQAAQKWLASRTHLDPILLCVSIPNSSEALFERIDHLLTEREEETLELFNIDIDVLHRNLRSALEHVPNTAHSLDVFIELDQNANVKVFCT